ncbi:uncharacterized protein SETTUDRAFT_153180 [Exserohilum turcica Et28A]|uniref:Aquaporin-like protein n=1 Tax=Exserohilum turcicum (strain 28A) TaxID=671987 RepID=R0KTG8_EXST2|nr:uncharacterized protein SETTUDRAFT_153180 [Exserohilum turcica Et28A]EOA92214.1 hypothetical protein SETTUDRAFT_153180 [Exserohilum turcica Et28A]
MKIRNILPFHKQDTHPDSDTSRPQTGDTKTPVTRDGSKPKKTKSPRIPPQWRNTIIAALAEFAGTFMFLFFAFGGTSIANNSAEATRAGKTDTFGRTTEEAANTAVLLYISLAFGFSLMVNVWIFFRVTGGLFNPAVTLGLYLINALTASRAILCFIAQMLAGMAAAAVIQAILPGPLKVSTTLGPGMTPARGVFLEMFLTSLLVFTIFMLAAEKHKATFLAPIGIGLSLFVIELMGVFFTGGSVNPARTFGPCVVTHDFQEYHYIYWFGPVMGTLLAFVVYKIVKWADYETLNPGQDFDDQEAAIFPWPEDLDNPEEVQRPVVLPHQDSDVEKVNREQDGTDAEPGSSALTR